MTPDLAARCIAALEDYAEDAGRTREEVAALLAELRQASQREEFQRASVGSSVVNRIKTEVLAIEIAHRLEPEFPPPHNLSVEAACSYWRERRARAEAAIRAQSPVSLLAAELSEAEAERDRLRADLETERRQAGMDLRLLEAQRDLLRALLLRALASWKGRHDPALPLDLSLWDEIEEELR